MSSIDSSVVGDAAANKSQRQTLEQHPLYRWAQDVLMNQAVPEIKGAIRSKVLSHIVQAKRREHGEYAVNPKQVMIRRIMDTIAGNFTCTEKNPAAFLVSSEKADAMLAIIMECLVLYGFDQTASVLQAEMGTLQSVDAAIPTDMSGWGRRDYSEKIRGQLFNKKVKK